jgi:predicted dehydrogenase/threonine dehydrogenase-like Zn-dependent dehydrogenase
MKQIIQDLGSGETRVVEVPRPAPAAQALIIDSRVTLVSVGTERMLVEFGKASMIEKARKQPEKVKQVLDKVRTDGLMTTVDAVRSKLAQPIPLGYSSVGIVAEVGARVAGFKRGDRVVSNGSHAEVVRVPINLCAKIPANVSDETAAFTVVASIGLQGVRLVNPTLGETVVVMGAGLIGLLTVQILLANGCRVLATDFDCEKLALAASWGAETCNLGKGEDPVARVMDMTGGTGADGVLITASTPSNDPIRQAANMSRKRGRIVLVGVIGLELNRADFYEKELSFQVSCSYGPGRYDAAYEQEGHDYPLPFVRWTQQRNFEAVLSLMATGRIDVSKLISRRVLIEDAPAVYGDLTVDKSLLGVLIAYDSPDTDRLARTTAVRGSTSSSSSGGKLGVIGAGNYASRVLLPALKGGGAEFGPIVTSAGLSGSIAAEKFGFAESTTDLDMALADPGVGGFVIATQHDSHAGLAARVLDAGKDVFVEKPLAIDLAGLEMVRAAFERQSAAASVPRLMVGFNRRWAPLVIKMKAQLDTISSAKSFVMTMNAGVIPADHWTQNLETGGGRIIGEACHFIDLMRFLAGSPIVGVTARRMGDASSEVVKEDKAFIIIDFADGSHGVIHYLGNGSASFPKERIEAFVGGRVLQLDNYRTLKGFGWPGMRTEKAWKQDKGQTACAAAFVNARKAGGPSPIPADQIFEVAEWTLKAAEQLRSK